MREMKDSGVAWIGEIPKDWKVAATKTIFDIYSGATPKSNVEKYWGNDVPWVTPADYKTYDVYVDGGKRSLSFYGLESCSATKVPKGSLIFSKRAPIGAVAISTKALATNQGCLSCVPKTDYPVKFFYYVMACATKEYELLGSGTTFKEISASSFNSFSVPIPLKTEQDKIIDVLDGKCSKVDALISNNEAQIEKLKQYKQSLITEVVTKGLDPTVPMKDSGVEWIGEIPEKWSIVRKLSYLTTESISYGIVKLLDPDEINGVKVLRCSDVLDGYICEDNIRTVKTEVSNEYARTILSGGEVVVNVRGSLGGCAVVPEEMVGYNIAREVAKISLNNLIYNRYVMYYLLSKCFTKYRTSHLSGSVYVGLNIELLSSCPIPFPNLEVQHLIVNYLDTKCTKIDRLIATKQAKIEKLNQYKKSLIYEYVTGKKDV